MKGGRGIGERNKYMSKDLFDQYGHPVNALVDPANPSELFDRYGRPCIVVEDYTGLDLAAASAISVLSRRGFWMNGYNYHAQNAVKVGSGNVWAGGNFWSTYTGTTANSKAIAHQYMITGLAPSYHCDWDKAFILSLMIHVVGSDSQCIRRWQRKNQSSPDETQLSDKGIGLELQNLALFAESYGTERGVLDLTTIMVSGGASIEAVLVHTPGVKQEWYVNGVLKATQSDLNKIPNGVSFDARIVQSACNGVAGGVSCHLYCGNWHLWTSRV
jgi:hypothetical protein